MSRYEIFCSECGEPRNILQDRCSTCGALQKFTPFEQALAEYEASSQQFAAKFSQEFGAELRNMRGAT